jgi:large subunit ribosomal protein L35
VAVLSLVRQRTGAGRRGRTCSKNQADIDAASGAESARASEPHKGDEQMPKLKTKSGAKKRFKLTGTGKVVYSHRGKRHGMIKRTNKQIRNLRGTNVLFKTDGDNVKQYFLPNA